ncbi:MAG TPA: hypothetical protein VLE91_03575 [Candidatus Saccharimonadales bacterium]|nr:hypothetical protein [Candidatus Saccharimonadales bacterium]
MDKVKKIERLEKRVVSEEGEIKKLEEKISQKEDRILKSQSMLLKTMGGVKVAFGAAPAYHAKFVRLGIVKRFGKHKLLYSFVTLVSVILIWTGLQTFINKTPGISNPLISIAIGLLIVWVIDRELV